MIEENPEEFKLCIKYAHEPNEETRQAPEESRKLDLPKAISGDESLRQFDAVRIPLNPTRDSVFIRPVIGAKRRGSSNFSRCGVRRGSLSIFL